MQIVGTPLLILELGGGAVALGLVWALQFGPIPMLAPVIGVYADRFSKRRTLVFLQAVLATQAAIFALLLVLGNVTLPAILVLSAVFGLANAAEMPVRQAFVAELVPDDDLVNAIVLHQAAFNLTRMVGPAIAGLVIAFAGASMNFGLAAVASLGAVVMFLAIRPLSVTADAAIGGVLRQLIEALRVSLASPSLRWPLGLLAAASTFGISFQAILPIHLEAVLGLDPSVYGLMLAALGLGAVVAAVPMAYVRTDRAPGIALWGTLALGCLLLALAANDWPALAVLLLVLIGFSFLTVLACVNLTIQSHIDHGMRGRVMGQYVAVFHGGVAVGSVMVGVLTEAFGTTSAIAGSATALLVIALAVRLRSGAYFRRV